MMVQFSYVCRFCKQPRMMDCEADDACPPETIEKLKALVVCDPCADFERARRDAEAALMRRATMLHASRFGLFHTDQRLVNINLQAKDALERLAKKLAKILCDRRGIVLVWDDEAVEMIMRRPLEVWTVINLIGKTVNEAARSRELPLTTP